MDIELLDTNGDVITKLVRVKNPEGNFNTTWKDMYNAASWRGYIPPMMAEPSLAEVIATSLVMIDEGAGKVRMKYLTSVPGQESTYQEKAQDAANYKVDGYPVDTTLYPWVAAEAGATGTTPTVAADTILATKSLWVTKGAEIEGERMRGKTEVKLASTVTEALDIRNTTLRNFLMM